MIVSLFFVEYAVELANALSNNNRIYLVLSKKCVERTMGDSFQKKVSHRVQYELLPDFSVKHSSLIKTIINIRRSCKAFRPDIVHIQSGRNIQNLFYLLFSFKPTVHTLHDVVLHPGSQAEFDKPWRRWTRDKLRRYAYNKIIVHGNLLKKKFISQHKKAPEDVHVVPHGCLFSFLTKKKHAVDEEPYTILFFGRMEEYKGLKDLIEAEPLISREIKNIKIVIAGEGIDLEKQSINIKSNAHFEVHHYFIANDEVPYFFERAALIGLPYI